MTGEDEEEGTVEDKVNDLFRRFCRGGGDLFEITGGGDTLLVDGDTGGATWKGQLEGAGVPKARSRL